MQLDSPIRTRFWASVNKAATDQCWHWTGSTDGRYGQFWLNRHWVKAHRLAYEILVGPIPAGLCVCHTCDQPPCVNPAHLFLATHAENMQDSARKGRHGMQTHPECCPRDDAHYARRQPHRLARGEAHGSAKLTPTEVREIRRLAAEGSSFSALGRRFGVNNTTARRIAVRELWNHV